MCVHEGARGLSTMNTQNAKLDSKNALDIRISQWWTWYGSVYPDITLTFVTKNAYSGHRLPSFHGWRANLQAEWIRHYFPVYFSFSRLATGKSIKLSKSSTHSNADRGRDGDILLHRLLLVKNFWVIFAVVPLLRISWSKADRTGTEPKAT